MSSSSPSNASAASPALRVVSYWRDSLADGARQDVARTELARVVADPAGRFSVPRDLLRDGVVPGEPERIREIFRMAAKSAGGEDAGDDAPSCVVLVCPLVARGEVKHGVRAAVDDFVVPLWIPAILSRDGRLSPPPDAAPWIPRDRLEPGGREARPVLLGRVDAVDRFLSVTEPPDTTAGWTAYWDHAWSMLKAVGRDAGWKLTPDGFDLGALRLARPGAYVTLPTGFVVPQSPPAAMVAPLMATYEHVLGERAMPALLQRFAVVEPREQATAFLGCNARLQAHARHVGQMSDRHALAPSQRDALHHALWLEDGDLLAINGPPGTGKTTLLQSVVASLWVRAALEQGEPPVIVATSANNQAVTNVIESFGKAVQAEGPLAGRWLPGVESFGLFCAAKDKQDGAAKKYQVASFQGGPFPQLVQSPEYVALARTEFLAHAAAAFGTPFPGVAQAVSQLHGELQRVVAVLEDGVRRRQALLHARVDAESHFDTVHLSPLMESAAAEVEELEQGITQARARFDAQAKRLRAEHDAAVALALRNCQAEGAGWLSLRQRWQAFDGATPWWMVALGWLPPVRAHRLALIRRFVAATNHTTAPAFGVPEDVDRWIDGALDRLEAAAAECIRSADGVLADGLHAAQAEEAGVRIPAERRLSELRDRLRALRHAQARLDATEHAWTGWVEALGDEAARRGVPLPNPEEALEAADRLLRARAFQLATHYWEGRWLEEMHEAIEADALPRLERRARDPQEARWRRYAKLTPCIVCTLYKLPAFFTWWGGEKAGNIPLLSYIDLLIVDEAGQVSPELAGAAFALARRALVVGDVEQLRPVWSVTAWGDAGNLRAAGLADAPREYERMAETGITAAGGSAMRVAQRQSPYRLAGLPYGGMLLTEHYRCAPSIIAYCNELCYGGRLVPVRAADAEAPRLPRMGYAHVRGTARRIGGSRDNPVEAQVLARWIVEHADALRELGARARGLPADAMPPLSEVVAVVTPFRAQAALVRRALGRHGDGLVINTVHALQGDERDVILFSPVYTQDERGSRLMLEDRALLNVAVSRARESFLVFGDMGVFDVRSGTPSGLLGRHLMARQENEITDVVVPAVDGLDPVRVISGLEPHRAALRQFFTSARHVVRITSPWITAATIRGDGIEALVREAVAREVQVVCYVDADLNRDGAQDHPNAAEGKRLLVESGATVRIARRIHNKTITVDDRVICEGSFNWLSAVRRAESPYHRLERTLVYDDGAAPLIARFLADIEPRVVETIQAVPPGGDRG